MRFRDYRSALMIAIGSWGIYLRINTVRKPKESHRQVFKLLYYGLGPRVDKKGKPKESRAPPPPRKSFRVQGLGFRV